MNDLVRERVRLGFDGGFLTGELAYGFDQPAGAVLLLNPHPYMGGRMDNNVIAALATGLASAGYVTLRFDYRGVGTSDGAPVDLAQAMDEFWTTGHAPMDPLMIADAELALGWLRHQTDAPLALIGYSFGAYVLSQVVTADTRGVVVISPTINHHDLAPLRTVDADLLVVTSDNDFAASSEDLDTWCRDLVRPLTRVNLAGAEHFYRNQEPDVLDACGRFLRGVMTPQEVSSCR